MLLLITFMFTPLYSFFVIRLQLLTSSFRLHEAVQFVIINMDEHCYNHIGVVCTLHCQILYHDDLLFQYNLNELFN